MLDANKTVSDNIIAEKLGRSVESVINKRLKLLGPRHPPNKMWTQEEHDELKRILENDASVSDEVIAARLGRTHGAVKRKRRLLTNVRRPGLGEKWTQEEDSELKRILENDASVSDEVIAAKLGRTYESIRNRRLLLTDVKRSRTWRQWTQEEDDELKRILDNDANVSNEVIAARLGRTGASVYNRRRDITRFRH